MLQAADHERRHLDHEVATAGALVSRWVSEPLRRGPFPWGQTSLSEWSTWLDMRTREADEAANREARRLWQVADAYAHGYAAAMKRNPDATPAYRAAVESAAYAFGHEYEHAAWMYAHGWGNFRDGYMRAWELHLEAKGLL